MYLKRFQSLPEAGNCRLRRRPQRHQSRSAATTATAQPASAGQPPHSALPTAGINRVHVEHVDRQPWKLAKHDTTCKSCSASRPSGQPRRFWIIDIGASPSSLNGFWLHSHTTWSNVHSEPLQNGQHCGEPLITSYVPWETRKHQ